MLELSRSLWYLLLARHKVSQWASGSVVSHNVRCPTVREPARHFFEFAAALSSPTGRLGSGSHWHGHQMEWREHSLSSDFSDEPKENYSSANKLILSPPRDHGSVHHGIYRSPLERSPLDELDDFNPRASSTNDSLLLLKTCADPARSNCVTGSIAPQEFPVYRSPTWVTNMHATEEGLDRFSTLLAEMEAETRALHTEWSSHPEAEAGAAPSSAPQTADDFDPSLEQRVRSLDLEVRK